MKIALFTLITATLFSLSSLAIQKVGDRVLYFGTFEDSNREFIKFEQSFEVVKIEPPDVHLQVLYKKKGEPARSTLFKRRLNELTISLEESIKLSTEKGCDSVGGIFETKWVPAGEFKTCKIQTKNNILWIAPVPFGFVKAVTTNDKGDTTTLTLKHYKFGK